MKLATWNVNSIRARWGRLSAWLTAHNPDVVCLQETKVEEGLFPHFELKALGYEAVHLGQKTYNGVAIVVRGPRPTEVESGFGDGVDDPQARFIVARVAGLRIASAYIPNGQAVGSEKFGYKLAWLKRLHTFMAAQKSPEPFFLCGDFNIAPADGDVYDPEGWRDQVLCHPDERAALSRLVQLGWADLFRQHHQEPGLYTWWDYRQLGFPKNRGLRIDHIFGNAAAAARTKDVVIDREARKGAEPSDHAPVIATIE